MAFQYYVTQFSGGDTPPNITPEVDGVASYLQWLCGRFGLEAEYNLGNGTGAAVLPIYSKPIPNSIEFTVAESGSFIIAGQSTAVIPNYKNYNMIFVRGGITQPSVNLGSSYFTWDKITSTFNCYPAASDGEIFQLMPTI